MIFKRAQLFFLVKQVNFHDYTFFYPQFTLIAQHIFTEHIAGRCEARAI